MIQQSSILHHTIYYVMDKQLTSNDRNLNKITLFDSKNTPSLKSLKYYLSDLD